MPVSRHAVEVGVLGGLGEALIFAHFMPSVADIRAEEPYNQDIEKAERTALLVGTGWLILLTAFTQKAETFAIAGAVLVGVDFAFKHANATYPGSGTMQPPGSSSDMTLSPLPDYTEGTG